MGESISKLKFCDSIGKLNSPIQSVNWIQSSR